MVEWSTMAIVRQAMPFPLSSNQPTPMEYVRARKRSRPCIPTGPMEAHTRRPSAISKWF